MSCHEERAIFGFVVHLAQLRKRQINCVYFLSLRESGLVKASVASPHSFPYIPAPSKNQVPGAALHFASCFVVFRRLFFCFFFLMLPDHQLSSSKRATFPFMTINLTAHLLTPAHSRAIAPPPARVCGVRGNPLFLEPRNPPNLTVTSIFSRHAGSELQRAAASTAFSRTLVRRDGTTVKGPDVPVRARRACVSEDRRKENRKELVAPFCDR